MPSGVLATVPLPVRVTANANVGVGDVAKVAETLVAASTVTTHGVVPLQAPLQPLKVEPGSGAAVSVTIVPPAKLEVHATPQ